MARVLFGFLVGLASTFALPLAGPAGAAPRPPAGLEGSVRRALDGSPVDGALVVARSEEKGSPLVWVHSDVDGSFALPVRGGGPFTVRVEAEDLAPEVRAGISVLTALAFTLESGATLEGVVRDASGSLVPGAHVEARDGEAASLTPPFEPGAGVRLGRSDAEGRFRLTGLARTRHDVVARLRGVGRGTREDVRPGSPVEVFLSPAPTVVGRVHLADGTPVPGAVAWAESRSGQAPSPAERTDAEGRFEIAGKPGETLDVWVRRPGWAPALATARLGADGEVPVDVVLERGARVAGRLVDSDRRPLAGQVVVEALGEAAVSPLVSDAWAVDAAADGRFVLTLVPSGPLRLTARSGARGPQPVEIDVGLRQAQVDLGDVVLEPTLALRGRVRDATGRPVADATVSVPAPSRPRPLEARTGADGAFVLAGLPAQPALLQVRARGFAPARRHAMPGEAPVEVVLEAEARISGLVVDEAGRPVDGATAAATAAEEGDPAPRVRARAAEGRFTLDGLAAGRYVVEVTAPGKTPAVVPGVTMAAGETRDVGRVRLPSGTVLRGVVVDAAGVPVSGAAVRAVAASGKPRQERSRATTGGDGTFELRGVPAGRLELLASHPQFATTRLVVEASAAEAPPEVRLTLARGGRLQGTVRLRGIPAPGYVVAVEAAPPRSEERVDVGPDGEWSLDRVPAGRVGVRLYRGSAAAALDLLQRREVEVREDEAAVVDFEAREILVSGRLTRGGVPVPGQRVRFLAGPASVTAPPPASGAPAFLVATTHEDGSFELLVPRAGSYPVEVSAADGSRVRRLSAEVPDAERAEVSLVLGGATASGVVLEGQAKQPVPGATVVATPLEGGARAQATTGPDGRFDLDLAPGRYSLAARAKGYAVSPRELTVDADPVPEQVLEIERGGVLLGRVLDPEGNPVPGLTVTALAAEGGRSTSFGEAATLPDGSFRLEGLAERPHDLFAGAEPAGYARASGVVPGGPPVRLVARLGGRVQVHVVDEQGASVPGASVRLGSVNGSAFDIAAPDSDPQGQAELAVPAGRLELRVAKGQLDTKVALTVREGQTVQVEARLAPPPPVIIMAP